MWHKAGAGARASPALLSQLARGGSQAGGFAAHPCGGWKYLPGLSLRRLAPVPSEDMGGKVSRMVNMWPCPPLHGEGKILVNGKLESG